jgi:hypothetical protein
MKTAADILDVKQALYEFRNQVDPQARDSFTAIRERLGVYGARVLEMQLVLQDVEQLLYGSWDPDDVDRHRLLTRIQDLVANA